jgi:tetratricopeptide (TPR) repeat protein
MRKWLGILIMATFGFCAMHAFADDQGAVSAAKMASESQPPVLQGDSAQAPAGAPVAGVKAPINFGDYRSSTLVAKAWGALARNDIESVLAYTNKCISLYGAQAGKMQAGLKDYVSGSNSEIFKYWALNDVATSYYIQGAAYLAANMKDEAKEAFKKLIKDYSFGQTWDTKGWFWKLADAAKEKLDMMEAGVNWDFGDYTSNTLVKKAWAALAANDLKAVEAYVNKTVKLYAGDAKEMQASLKEYPWESKEKIFSYWALNDVGTALFILGEAYQNAGKKEEAASEYKRVVNEFFYAQCWDQGGWFWKPAEASQQKLGELDNV